MNRWFLAVAVLMCSLATWAQGDVRWLELEHDFGTFKEEAGKQSHSMRMVNIGDEPIVITRTQTSCGCTATEYTKDAINPGDTAIVTVTYNPYNRPGAFEKVIWVYTSGETGRTQLTVRGHVVAAQRTVDEKYPVRAGNLRLETENVPLGEVYRGAQRNAYISCYNPTLDTVLVTVEGNSKHVKLSAAPSTVAPGEASALVLHYDTRHAPLWGLNVDTLTVITEALHNSPTATGGVASVYVMAQVMESMANLTDEQKQNAPEAVFDTEKLVFDAMRPGKPATCSFAIKNTGKSDLLVRRLWCAEPAVTVVKAPEVIKKGMQDAVVVQVDPARIDGVLNTQLKIMTNDPYNPVTLLRVVGVVKKDTTH